MFEAAVPPALANILFAPQWSPSWKPIIEEPPVEANEAPDIDSSSKSPIKSVGKIASVSRATTLSMEKGSAELKRSETITVMPSPRPARYDPVPSEQSHDEEVVEVKGRVAETPPSINRGFVGLPSKTAVGLRSAKLLASLGLGNDVRDGAQTARENSRGEFAPSRRRHLTPLSPRSDTKHILLERERQWDSYFTVTCASRSGVVRDCSEVPLPPMVVASLMQDPKALVMGFGLGPAWGKSTDFGLEGTPGSLETSKLSEPPPGVALGRMERPLERVRLPMTDNDLDASLASYLCRCSMTRPGIDWHGSILHASYMRCAEEVHRSWLSTEELHLILDKPELELQGSFEELDLELLSAKIQDLFDELQVPVDDRPEFHLEEWSDPAELESAAKTLKRYVAYRGATVLVIHRLLEHEWLLSELRQRLDQGERLRENDAQLEQLLAVDDSLETLMENWSQTVPGPFWNDSFLEGTDTVAAAPFMWRGSEARWSVRKETFSLRRQIALASAATLPHERQKTRWRAPQNCAQRAALGDARALRSLLRSSEDRHALKGGLSSTFASTSMASSGAVSLPPVRS